MIKHNGMRPHDIVILCKILVSNGEWKSLDISKALKISAAEVSYSLQRSVMAGLLDYSKTTVMRQALLDFIQFGLPYVFPAVRGAIAIGVPTAYAAPIMEREFRSNEKLVWAYRDGNVRGESIEPLYPKAIDAAMNDQEVYDILTLLDVMRIGKVREKAFAMNVLIEMFTKTHA